MIELAGRSAAFVAWCFAISWSAWAASGLLGGVDGIGALPYLVGGAGPALAALAVTQEPSRGTSRFAAIRGGRRPAWLLWIVAVGAGPAAVAAASRPHVQPNAASVAAIVGAIGFAVAAGIAEEPGWRGTLLDDLADRYSPLQASLLVWAAWATWHLPLYLLPGTYQHDHGAGGLTVQAASLLPLSILLTWVYLGALHSTAAAVLVHALGNATGGVFPGQDIAGGWIKTAVLAVVAGAVAYSWHQSGRGTGVLGGLGRTLGRGVIPEAASFLLTNPARRLLQFPPRALRPHLPVPPDGRVLEVGCGPGYFSVELAGLVPLGQLDLVDIQPGMLDRAVHRLERAGKKNYRATEASAEQLPFPNDTFDAAVVITVLGEVPDLDRCLTEIYRTLRTGGTLLVAEHWSDPDFQPADEVARRAHRAGFRDHNDINRPGRNYIATFMK